MSNKLTPAEGAALVYVHQPGDANDELLKLGRKMYGTTGISSGSRALDEQMIPTRPSQVRYWTALPGHGKSTILRAVARREAERLLHEGLDDKFYVAHVTYEESVEAQVLNLQRRTYTNEQFWRGQVSPETILRDGINYPQIPLIIFGQSMDRSTIESPPMTLDVVLDGLRALFKLQGRRPTLLCIDYVQQIITEGVGNRTMTTVEAMNRVVNLGVQTGCAIELGAQANKLAFKNEPLPIPNEDQIEYSHLIHQLATNGVGICRPYAWRRDLEFVKVNGKSYPNHPHLTIFRPLKHRPGKPAEDVPCLINPDTLDIADWGGEPESENKEPKQLVF